MFFVRGDGMAEIGCGCRGGVAIVLFMDEGILILPGIHSMAENFSRQKKRKVTDLHFGLFFTSDFLILKSIFSSPPLP